jgi:hypothetical protein
MTSRRGPSSSPNSRAGICAFGTVRFWSARIARRRRGALLHGPSNCGGLAQKLAQFSGVRSPWRASNLGRCVLAVGPGQLFGGCLTTLVAIDDKSAVSNLKQLQQKNRVAKGRTASLRYAGALLDDYSDLMRTPGT